MNFETPGMVGGRAGALAKGRTLTLWVNCVMTNALTPRGNGRTLAEPMARRVQEASRAAALATGLYTQEQIEKLEFVELYPESSNTELGLACLKGVEKYCELCPDREAMISWRRFAKFARTRLAQGLPINRELARVGEVESEVQGEVESEAPSATDAAAGSDKPALVEGGSVKPNAEGLTQAPPPLPPVPPGARKAFKLHAGFGHGVELELLPDTGSIVVAQVEGLQQIELVEEREHKHKLDEVVALAERSNTNALANDPPLPFTDQVGIYHKNAKGVFECMGKKKFKKPEPAK